jgi:hypothetical protein
MSHTYLPHETKWEQRISKAGRDQQLIRCLMKTSCQWREVGPSKAYQTNRRPCCFNFNDLFHCMLLCVWDVCVVLTLRRLYSALWMKINHLVYDRGGQTFCFRGPDLAFYCLSRNMVFIITKFNLNDQVDIRRVVDKQVQVPSASSTEGNVRNRSHLFISYFGGWSPKNTSEYSIYEW